MGIDWRERARLFRLAGTATEWLEIHNARARSGIDDRLTLLWLSGGRGAIVRVHEPHFIHAQSEVLILPPRVPYTFEPRQPGALLVQLYVDGVEHPSDTVQALPEAEVLGTEWFIATLRRFEREAAGEEGARALAGAIIEPLMSCARERRGLKRHERAAVRRAREFILGHVGDTTSVEELARVAGLSREHLVRSFHDDVGLPPLAYQLQMRLAHARAMLRRGLPLADVAQDVGFCDQSHLSRHFKRHVGITPQRYARGSGTY